MSNALQSELLRIAQAIAFPAPGAVALSGHTAPYAGAPGANAMAGIAPAASPLATQLTQLLYEWCYCRRFGSAAAAPQAAPTADPAFSGPLAAANAGREHWDAGWIIQQSLPSGQIVVVKGAMTRLVWPGEFLAHGAHGTAPRPGVEVSLFAPRDSWTLQPGFYFVFG